VQEQEVGVENDLEPIFEPTFTRPAIVPLNIQWVYSFKINIFVDKLNHYEKNNLRMHLYQYISFGLFKL